MTLNEITSNENFKNLNETDEKYYSEPIEIASQPKKYVIKIEAGNVNFIDSLTLDERNEVVNNMITETILTNQEQDKNKNFMDKIKHGVVIFTIVAIGVPLLLNIINFSISSTQNSYKEMQDNFKVLYKSRNKI